METQSTRQLRFAELERISSEISRHSIFYFLEQNGLRMSAAALVSGGEARILVRDTSESIRSSGLILRNSYQKLTGYFKNVYFSHYKEEADAAREQTKTDYYFATETDCSLRVRFEHDKLQPQMPPKVKVIVALNGSDRPELQPEFWNDGQNIVVTAEPAEMLIYDFSCLEGTRFDELIIDLKKRHDLIRIKNRDELSIHIIGTQDVNQTGSISLPTIHYRDQLVNPVRFSNKGYGEISVQITTEYDSTGKETRELRVEVEAGDDTDVKAVMARHFHEILKFIPGILGTSMDITTKPHQTYHTK